MKGGKISTEVQRDKGEVMKGRKISTEMQNATKKK